MIYKRSEDDSVYEVDSDTSTRKYIVSWGTEGGEYWVCTCVAYSIDRNRNGGLGNAGHCKHIIQVELAVAEKNKKENVVASIADLARELKG